ncbi:cold shock domain-containing protein [Kineococcus sp. NBC_00420]|uniref:cold-shock protein n=1 Tax=Kineococcus sp. NBC_00420 TaxID=2903564 RepID=UPI002E1B57E5
MSTRGVVRDWHDEEGWGVIDSSETPGGCWVHYSAAMTTQEGLRPGQDVAFTYEQGEQDGYHYRAQRAWPWGQDPAQRPGTMVFNDRSGAFTSSLTLTYDDPAAAEAAGAPQAGTTHWPPAATPVLGTVTVTVFERAPGRNEVRIDTRGMLNEQLMDAAMAELQQVRQQLPD